MLQNSDHDAPGRREVISFRVADQDFCIDIGVVREIRGWTDTTTLPHAQPYVKGVVNLRGTIIAVVDLSARLGFGPTAPSARHIIIIVSIGDQTIGLLADLVSDILTIDESAMKNVPDIASEIARDFISNMVTFDDGRMLRQVDLARIIPELGSEAA